MQILFLTQVLPYPLDAGGKVRTYYLLRHLTQSHSVDLVSFVRQTDTKGAIDHLRGMCQGVYTIPMKRSGVRNVAYVLASLATSEPWWTLRDRVPFMFRRVQDLVQKTPYDVFHADQLNMAPYALAARAHSQRVRPARPRLVLDQHNAVHLILARLAARERDPLRRAVWALDTRKLARYEALMCSQFDHLIWVTREDQTAVQLMADRAGLQLPAATVIPVCIDPDSTPALARRNGVHRVTFLGGLHYPPNTQGILWFAEQVFPRVLARVPDAVLTIIGKDPPPELNHARKWGIGSANLDVTGYVADPRPYLEETGAFVVPLLAGGGMRVKILDGWLWGLPLVSTTIGAEGIEYHPGEDILIADTPEDFADTVVRLMQDGALAARLTAAGRKWAETRYDWRTAYAALSELYRMLERGQP